MTPEEMEAARAYDRALRLKHLDTRRERNRNWYRGKTDEEKTRIKEQLAERRRERSAAKKAVGRHTTEISPYARTVRNVRNRLWAAMRKHAARKVSRDKDGSVHLQIVDVLCRMKKGMCLSGYGREWEMDHVIPCAWFDMTREDHRYACSHASNVNPEWRGVNRSKMTSLSRRQIDEVLSRCPLECIPVIEEIVWKIRRKEYPERMLRRVHGHI